MSFVRLLPLLLLVPALTMADVDKNFKIQPKQFKVGTVVDPIANMALKAENGVAISEELKFPLQENKIFLRHKQGPKEYQWISGTVVASGFKKLHAFSLKSNYLKAEEVVKMRFYGTQNAKAFQDETDVYFDRDYIYSSRVPKLFFIKNGQWQMLKETVLPGVIKISSDNRKLEVASMKVAYEKAPKVIFPVKAGSYAFVFSAPEALPYADIGVVDEGGELTFKPKLVKVQKDFSKKPAISITPADIAKTKNLEQTEALYDKFVLELDAASADVDMDDFNADYPRKKVASALGISEKDKSFVEYSARYDVKRAESQRIWRTAKVGDVSYVSEPLQKKLDSLQALPLRGSMMPIAAEPIFIEVPADNSIDSAKAAISGVKPAKVATVKKMDQLKLKFGAERTRFDFEWTGVAEGVPVDSLYSWLTSDRADMIIYLNLQNNKPVWVYKEGSLEGRYQYRYVSLEFQVGDVVYTGKGSFSLPDYIFNEPEVQEWLKERNAPIQAPKKTAKDTVFAKDAAMPSIDNIATSAKIVRDRVHGTVALIDSGTFRFSGHVVSMSPFAIMTTEMTQKLFEQTMMTLDSTKRIKDRSTFKNPNKPVHNITWDDARMVCKTLGGDLPTEAQWEFAARADNVEGAVWVLDSIPDPGSYAVYRGNSYNLGKRFSEYGPQPVGSKKPNAWGLYDMSGNVAEWTRDKYFMFSFYVEASNPTGAMIGSSKVLKGGSWKDGEKALNVIKRDDEDPRYWSETIGFRCVYPREIIKE